MTTNPNKIKNHRVQKSGFSDHLYGVFNWSSIGSKPKPKYILARDYSEFNWSQANAELREDESLITASISQSTEEITTLIQTAVIKVLDNQAPLNKIQISDKTPKFATMETRNLIKEKDKAYKKAKMTGLDDDVRNYNSIRNKVNKCLKKDKKDKIKKTFTKIEGNPKKQWQSVKNTLGWKKYSSPAIIVEDGKTKTTSKQIADSLNFNMIKKNIKLYREIPDSKTDWKVNYKKLVGKTKPKFTLKSIDMSTLRKTINNMRATPSTGVDLISMKTLKNLMKPLENSLLNLVNTTIGTTNYPSQLKKSKVIPLLKQGKPENLPGSYRGVNILPAIGKIVDKVIYSQLLKHLEVNKLIPESHHGGIQGRSTVTATATLIDEWAQNMENNIDMAIIILDQSAAYDIVPHNILVEKLDILGADKHAQQYFSNYLLNRSQKVILEGTYSEEFSIHRSDVSSAGEYSLLPTVSYLCLGPTSTLPYYPTYHTSTRKMLMMHFF